MTRRDSCGKAGTHAGITEHSIAREPMCGECAEFHATYRGARGVRPTVLRVETEDVIFDPFGGLFTVPLRAVKLGRRGRGVELNAGYFADGVDYLRRQDAEASVPSLFDAALIDSGSGVA